MVVEIKYLAQVDKEKCIGCGSCENVCPTTAINVVQLESPDEESVTPCRLACPARIDIQGYIAHISRGEFSEALKLIKEKNPLTLSVGRVCPHFCEDACRRNLVDQPIAINPLKRFVADYDQLNGIPFKPQMEPEKGDKVAIIGGGPAGLSGAYYLRLRGYGVTIFEAKPQLGGMLRYGIPEYRLPKKILDQEIKGIREMGVEIKTGVTFGKDISLKSIEADGYKAVFLATGLHLSRRLNIDNEDLEGVLKGVDFLGNVSLKYPVSLGKRVVIIGGGNVAIDVALTAIRQRADIRSAKMKIRQEIEIALTAIRQGAEDVSLVCLEKRDEMPAWKDEIQQALEEGVKIINGLGPNKFLEKDGKLSAIEFKRCTSVFNKNGAFDPQYDATDLTVLEADTAIVAIGQAADLSFLEKDPGLKKLGISKGGTLQANPQTLQSSIPNLFVGGDVVWGPQSVIQAIADGRTAANSIHQYLTLGAVQKVDGSKKKLPEADAWIFDYLPKKPRVQQPILPLPERVRTFKEVEATISQAEAIEEASRCLSCGQKAVVISEKCLACQNCRDICPVDAIKHVLRPVPLRLGVDPAEVDQNQLRELCLKAHLHPHQWLCLCAGVRVREGAAAVLKGAKTAEEIALMTGVLSGCTIYCRMICLRLLKAHGVEIKPPDKGYRWYGSTQTCWEVPEEVIKKYPGHFLKEDLDVFRKF
jgi:NADPH-dependent glutamate synthase beta subunit-like oxidoreductase/bacterioferritin-associated ferredoxin